MPMPCQQPFLARIRLVLFARKWTPSTDISTACNTEHRSYRGSYPKVFSSRHATYTTPQIMTNSQAGMSLSRSSLFAAATTRTRMRISFEQKASQQHDPGTFRVNAWLKKREPLTSFYTNGSAPIVRNTRPLPHPKPREQNRTPVG